MSPSERLKKAFELSRTAKELLKAGLRRRFPEKSEQELHRIYLQRISRCQNNNY
jgi:hypothetical protein